MKNITYENRKLSALDGSLIDANLKRIVACRTSDGRSFSAKYVAREGDKLYFEDSKGHIIMNDLSNLVSMVVYEPKKKVA